MTTGATGQLGLALPVQGELSGTWGDTVNNGITQYTNIAIAATLTLTNDGAVTLANTTGDASATNIVSSLTGAGTVTAQFAIVRVTGTLTTAKVITAPSYSKTYVVVNAATGGIVTFKASGQTGVSIAVGESAWVYYNGTDYVKIAGTTSGSAGGSNTQVQFNSSGSLAGDADLTFDGTTLSTAGLTASGTVTLSGGTANGVTYLNGSKVLTSGSALTFDGTNLGVGNASPRTLFDTLSGTANTTGDVLGQAIITGPDVAPAGTGGSGNLVIQTNSNQAANVGGTIAFGGRATDSSTVGRGYAVIKGAKENSTSANRDGYFAIFTRTEASGQTEKLRVDSAGNLGLGVTPSAWGTFKAIEIASAGSSVISAGSTDIRLTGNSYFNGTNWKYAATNLASMYSQNTGIHEWYIAASGSAGANLSWTTAMTLNASGNLGVGVTSINTTFHVQGAGTTDGSIKFNQQLNSTGAYNATPMSGTMVALKYNAGGDYAGMGGWSIGKENATDGNYSSYFAIHTRFNGAAIVEKARVSSDGGFSVGTTANPGAGAIYATGNITAYYSSDIKFKENVRDIPDALATVNAIGGKLFDWTDEYIESKGGADGYFVQKADFGVVAQDVQKVFPIAVRTREDGSLAVDYEKLGALAFAALGELTKRVEALEAK